MGDRETLRDFGRTIDDLIQGKDLPKERAYECFSVMLNDETTEIHQGAFLAALRAKGETADEIAGAWRAIYELDTVKVRPSCMSPIVENSGTGMDAFKTFNVSTAAAIVAAEAGVAIARHGARAITSACGTVDLAEELGIDVDCDAAVVRDSIEACSLGLFNGMSPKIHPRALGRILSKMSFGSTLNIAASLANPALPKLAVRGVYSRQMVRPVAEVMRSIGFERAFVVHGLVGELGMDEASPCGPSYAAELYPDGSIREAVLDPAELGIGRVDPGELGPSPDRRLEAERMVALLERGEPESRATAAALNSALILYVAGAAGTIREGYLESMGILRSGAAAKRLELWRESQGRGARP